MFTESVVISVRHYGDHTSNIFVTTKVATDQHRKIEVVVPMSDSDKQSRCLA